MARGFVLLSIASIAFLTAAPAAAQSRYDCPAFPVLEFVDPETNETYYTYYCDYYQGACDTTPEGCSEYTGVHEWPITPCGGGCIGPYVCDDCEGAAKSDAAGKRERAGVTADAKATIRSFPGLGHVKDEEYEHVFPGQGGGLATKVGRKRKVAFTLPDGAGTVKALEFRFRIPVADGAGGYRPKDFFLAFEADYAGAAHETYVVPETGPRGGRWWGVDTGQNFEPAPGVEEQPKFVLLLRS